MKINKLLITFAIMALTLVSCEQSQNHIDKSNVSKVNIEKVLNQKYHLVKTDIKKIDQNKLKFSKKDYDFSRAELYRMDSLGEFFLIIPNRFNRKNYTLLKFQETHNGYEVVKELTVKIDLDSNGDGKIEVTNLDEQISFRSHFINGKIIGEKVSKSNNINKAVAKKTTLCQRERNETFKQCFERETDEFCTDFTSTVAYYTNPGIPVLIAALCSC